MRIWYLAEHACDSLGKQKNVKSSRTGKHYYYSYFPPSERLELLRSFSTNFETMKNLVDWNLGKNFRLLDSVFCTGKRKKKDQTVLKSAYFKEGQIK